MSFTGPGCTGPASIPTDAGDTPTAGLFAYPSRSRVLETPTGGREVSAAVEGATIGFQSAPSRRTNDSRACGDESWLDPGIEAELVDEELFATYPPPYRLVAR